jgi:hypothetical protein
LLWREERELAPKTGANENNICRGGGAGRKAQVVRERKARRMCQQHIRLSYRRPNSQVSLHGQYWEVRKITGGLETQQLVDLTVALYSDYVMGFMRVLAYAKDGSLVSNDVYLCLPENESPFTRSTLGRLLSDNLDIPIAKMSSVLLPVMSQLCKSGIPPQPMWQLCVQESLGD